MTRSSIKRRVNEFDANNQNRYTPFITRKSTCISVVLPTEEFGLDLACQICKDKQTIGVVRRKKLYLSTPKSVLSAPVRHGSSINSYFVNS